MDKNKVPEKSRVRHFSWALADITDRHKALEGVDVIKRLAAIHRKYDPDGHRAMARLLKSFNENS